MNDRTELLARLLRLERPLGPVLEKLGEFGWDSDQELLEVSASDIRSALQAYIDKKVSSIEIEEWANAIECREDLKLMGNVKEAIHILANPILTSPLSFQAALKLMGNLNKEKTS
jgi:hypothetical protein